MNYRVFPIGIIIMLVYDLLALVSLCLVIFTPSPKDALLWFVSSFFFILLPFIFSIYILSFSLDVIIIDEECIKKIHYGKLKKIIKWEDVVTSKTYSEYGCRTWIYISNYDVSYNFFTSSLMMLDNRSICIKYTPKVVIELNRHLINKINGEKYNL